MMSLHFVVPPELCNTADGKHTVSFLFDEHGAPVDAVCPGLRAARRHLQRGRAAMSTEVRWYVTPFYPGLFMPEEGRPVRVADGSVEAALAAAPDDAGWFALEVREATYRRWESGDDVKWLPEGTAKRHRIYVGESLTAADVEALPGDNEILLSNMRGNGWNNVVRTRRGNFQPVEPDDVILTAARRSR